MAESLKKMGYHVLMVDADESNYGLHRLMGLALPENVMDRFGGKKGFQEKMAKLRQLPEGAHRGFFNEKWTFGSIPEEYVVQKQGIKLLLVGKIHGFAEGCACPMGMLSKMILSNLDLADNEAAIVDTEAGTEHFGRGLEGECDMILAVVDPTYESFLLAKKIEEMGKKANRPVWFLLNKTSAEIEEVMMNNLDSDKVIGNIPASNDIFMSSLKGAELNVELPEIDRVARFLINSAKKMCQNKSNPE